MTQPFAAIIKLEKRTLELPGVVEVVELWRVDEGEVEPRVVVLHLEVEPDEPDPPDGNRRARQDEARRGGQLQSKDG